MAICGLKCFITRICREQARTLYADNAAVPPKMTITFLSVLKCIALCSISHLHAHQSSLSMQEVSIKRELFQNKLF